MPDFCSTLRSLLEKATDRSVDQYARVREWIKVAHFLQNHAEAILRVVEAARKIPGMPIKAGARLYTPELAEALAALDATAPPSAAPKS